MIYCIFVYHIMTLYHPDLITKSYIESKNVLFLCFGKRLKDDIIRDISSYLFEYSTGFALFEYKDYKLDYKRNNIRRHIIRGKFIGHPLEIIIKILSKFGKDTTNKEFNEILEKIDRVPNYQKIDLMECLTFIIKQNTRLIGDIIQSSDFHILYCLINQYVGEIQISKRCMIIRYIKVRDREEKYHKLLNIYLNKKIIKLEDYIVKNSQLTHIEDYITKKTLCYEKQLMINHNIIQFEISRFGFDNLFHNDKVIIPYILDLPNSVFVNNEKKVYELISVVIFDNIKKKYSCIIKEDDNQYYHYLYDRILKIDDNYFYDKTSSNAIGLFYRML